MNEQEKVELAKVVCRGVDRVWDAIGMDALAIGDSSNPTMTAEEVCEICIDADRLKTFDEPDAEAAWELLGEDFDSYAKQLEFVASHMFSKIYGY